MTYFLFWESDERSQLLNFDAYRVGQIKTNLWEMERVLAHVRREAARARARRGERPQRAKRHRRARLSTSFPPAVFGPFSGSVINKPRRRPLVRHAASLTSRSAQLTASMHLCLRSTQHKWALFCTALAERVTNRCAKRISYDLGGLSLQMSTFAAGRAAVLSHSRKWLKVS